AVAETPAAVAEAADSVKDIIADAVKAADVTPVEAPAVAIPAVEVPAITPTPKVKSAASPSALAKTLAVAKAPEAAPAVAPEKPVVKPSRSKKS
ncbi:MAG: hypothetical protein JF615_08145, partial [Asticcacaulis sp.]|nr:hypothetical protein [Asticcacaulis sp.]